MSDQITPVIGLIGGSGLYDIEGLEDRRWERVESPWGEASDELLFGTLAGVRCVFLPRHGRGHRVPPSELNYRANIDVMKRAGCTEILSLSAVGSLNGDLPPGTFVIVDQFIDRTFARKKSFFETGCVAHVSMAHPLCTRLGDALEEAARGIGLKHRRGGTYLVMEGPQFSTKAESELYRAWGCDVIGMTNMPEAKLAREAELCYATVAMVTDYDCWHPDHDHVTVDAVVKVLLENAGHAKDLVRAVVPALGRPRGPCPQGCDRALDAAIVTPPEKRDPALMAKLDAVAGGCSAPAEAAGAAASAARVAVPPAGAPAAAGDERDDRREREQHHHHHRRLREAVRPDVGDHQEQDEEDQDAADGLDHDASSCRAAPPA